ncbi:Leucine-rich repeat, cysteine-containing subtype-containing protein [Strongyloides ratti]|uniref:Leucine-rich repeat, cysteine-containing subtype-containing protein n=1 Tax=Strongyloides ratti TaxID=34506 RepID=A0A090KWX7_STRRB|nr:Leucine-rich repeat, cysteine-containing subtype-containing protein [Strongyloides ratti]CEF60377.1 Leucine-rich repeat, cysteine-containing subtype-containing protein [Strongyloides ratti]
MVRTLFDISLSTMCRTYINGDLTLLPENCKQRLIEFFCSHDQFYHDDCAKLISSPYFGSNLTEINFYLSEQVNDMLLENLVQMNNNLTKISITLCQNITDKGILSLTTNQGKLECLELKCLNNLTSDGLKNVKSQSLYTVNLSGCTKITSDGIFHLAFNNPNITKFYLNDCRSIDDQALYDIAYGIGENLQVLELNFLQNMEDPAKSLLNLSQRCPHISQLSLCRFFEFSDEDNQQECTIEGMELREVDLYGNYFFTLPNLPLSVTKLSLSVSGEENATNLVSKLLNLPFLSTIHLQLNCEEISNSAIERCNEFLKIFIGGLGKKIINLHISCNRIIDEVLLLITNNIPNMTHLALNVKHINSYHLQRYFGTSNRAIIFKLRSLKLCRLKISYRALFAIARNAKCLEEFEASHMLCVDDRFLIILAQNCRFLKTINFNGCRWVTDRGLSALARNCKLTEVRIRATSCTDKSIYLLAQFCPEIEWIAYSDYSGRPKFSDKALQCLKNACVQRVIC